MAFGSEKKIELAMKRGAVGVTSVIIVGRLKNLAAANAYGLIGVLAKRANILAKLQVSCDKKRSCSSESFCIIFSSAKNFLDWFSITKLNILMTNYLFAQHLVLKMFKKN